MTVCNKYQSFLSVLTLHSLSIESLDVKPLDDVSPETLAMNFKDANHHANVLAMEVSTSLDVGNLLVS